MKMADVKQCDVSDCVYNTDHKCHTMAVTIGDGANPRCDTFLHANMKGGDESSLAGVGACKVAGCRFNEKYECRASEINVAWQNQEPDCQTFEAK